MNTAISCQDLATPVTACSARAEWTGAIETGELPSPFKCVHKVMQIGLHTRALVRTHVCAHIHARRRALP